MTKRVSKAKSRYEKRLRAASPSDQAEVARFEEFLKDRQTMSNEALMDKHWEYLGFKQKPSPQVNE